MADVIELLELSPASLLLAVLVFGIAPGLCLRVIVMLYPRDHPRRKELLAELYAMARIQRPFFVGEQLETALFEGLGARYAADSLALARSAKISSLCGRPAIYIAPSGEAFLRFRAANGKSIGVICSRDILQRAVDANWPLRRRRIRQAVNSARVVSYIGSRSANDINLFRKIPLRCGRPEAGVAPYGRLCLVVRGPNEKRIGIICPHRFIYNALDASPFLRRFRIKQAFKAATIIDYVSNS